MMNPQVIILAGPNQSGKSTILSALAGLLRAKGCKLAGILAYGLWRDNVRIGFDIVDLSDERVAPLCRRTRKDEIISGIPFRFLDAGVATGMKALSVESCAGADIVIVDEVGPLELRGHGWAECLDSLLKLHGATHIWVVRSDCVQAVCRKWNLANAEIVMVEGPDALNRLLAACLKKMNHGR
jgi:nucleoside-triphosphatase